MVATTVAMTLALRVPSEPHVVQRMFTRPNLTTSRDRADGTELDQLAEEGGESRVGAADELLHEPHSPSWWDGVDSGYRLDL